MEAHQPSEGIEGRNQRRKDGSGGKMRRDRSTEGLPGCNDNNTALMWSLAKLRDHLMKPKHPPTKTFLPLSQKLEGELADVTSSRLAVQAHEKASQESTTLSDLSDRGQIASLTATPTIAGPEAQPKLWIPTKNVYKNSYGSRESWKIHGGHNSSHLNQPVDYRACKRRYLPLGINGKKTYGLPDNALIGNAITEAWAHFIGAKIERMPSTHSFINAQGQSFESVGTTQLVVSISDPVCQKNPEKKWTCSFSVVKELAAPLVLGASFLRETETFTSLAHLLVKGTLSVTKRHWSGLKPIYRFMHMDLRTQNLDCLLDNERLFVSLDTGSDIDAVSLDYARSRNWDIQPCSADEAHVLLANNKLVKLAGYIETTLMLQRRCDATEQCVAKKLFVLDDLVCDVVLGDPTIEALDIFNEYKECIVDTVEPDGMDAFRMIQWIEKIDQLATDTEHMMLNNQCFTGYSQEQKRWNSIFRRLTLRKKAATEPEVTLQNLKGMLEVFDVCSANWRRAIESELPELVGQEHARRKEEIERRKERNKQIRNRILLLIRNGSLESTSGSSSV